MKLKTCAATILAALTLVVLPLHGAMAPAGRCDQGRYSAWDKAWLTGLGKGSHFEISAARMALERGNAEVKKLGSRIMADHTKGLEDVQKVAQNLSIPLGDTPEPSQEWMLAMLAKPSGDFDQAFVQLAVHDHVQDIEETQEEAKSGCNVAVRQLAENILPVLRRHLELAKKALISTGGDQ